MDRILMSGIELIAWLGLMAFLGFIAGYFTRPCRPPARKGGGFIYNPPPHESIQLPPASPLPPPGSGFTYNPLPPGSLRRPLGTPPPPIQGYSPIQLHRAAIGLALAAEEFEAHFYANHFPTADEEQDRWIPMEAWYENAGKLPLEELQGRFCTAGLDLASTVDLAAWCICWPPTMEDPDGPYYFMWRFWIPRENIRQRVRKDKVPYDAWVREGYIKATVGNCIDHATIRKDILADAERFKLKEFAFDRFGASEIVTYLQNEGLTATPFGQGTVSMNPPMRQLEGLLMARRAIHGGNPVATWNASNVVATEDSAGNLRPDRKKSIEKIDGTVAQLMSLGLAIRHKTKRSPSPDRQEQDRS